MLQSIKTVQVAHDWHPPLCGLSCYVCQNRWCLASALKVQVNIIIQESGSWASSLGFCFRKTKVTEVTVFALRGVTVGAYRSLRLHSECSTVERNVAGSRTNANDLESFFIFYSTKGSQCHSHSSHFLKKQAHSICYKWRKSCLGSETTAQEFGGVSVCARGKLLPAALMMKCTFYTCQDIQMFIIFRAC